MNISIDKGIKYLSDNIVNSCGLYIILWLIYYLQGFAYSKGGVISKCSLALILAITLYTSFKYFIVYHGNDYSKKLLLLLLMFSIYGGFHMLFDEQMILAGKPYEKFKYLQYIYLSILPVFSFSYFVLEGKLNVKLIVFFIPIFILITVAQYIENRQVRLEMVIKNGGSSHAELTNNVAYVFLSILPLTTLIKNIFIKYFYLFVLMVFIFLGMKRGSIFIGSLLFLYITIKTVQNSPRNMKFFVLLLTLLFLLLVSSYLDAKLSDSHYFQYRLNKTLQGDSNGRSSLFGVFWEEFKYSPSLIQQLFGNGADSTIRIGGNFAHNDWLEILTNQGLFGIVVYLFYWFSFIRLYFRSKGVEPAHMMVTMVLCVCFLKTLFSMSYGDMDIFLGIGVAWSSTYINEYCK